ncbi:ATP-dependent helicase [Methanolobus profundi]|uniref:DNA 3'-5' helicase n=1 Tax=Methanolobus profundi TaxID=487685 RepID=A0A1I4TVY0_9EURY|nr:ATP-dependent DNA helicase [Methanolobus profundi]SFM80755.1 DNA helicase-2 / ATP-dependent DNA helicase PcrA [Methanolobus profundi]
MRKMVAGTLNDGQLKAVTYTEGPLLILAGPGSGKTLTITEKVVDLIDNGISAERILALTFSEKAAGEMQERIERQIGIGSGISVSTFHSFCNELIRQFPLDMGISYGTRLISKEHSHVWGIRNIDTFEFENLIIPPVPYDLITSLMEGVSQFQDHLIDHDELKDYIDKKLSDPSIDDEEKDTLLKMADLERFYRHYQEYKWNNNFVDYDDMIAMACSLLEKNNVIKNEVKSRYDYILVDEFQDTNYAQLHLVHLLADSGNLTCVADDDQCIYRFRGAYLSNIKQLNDHYSNLEKVALEVNYRSTNQIVELSKQLVSCNPEREVKDFKAHNSDGELVKVVKAPDDDSEAEWVANEIKRLANEEGLEYQDIYILTRKRADGEKFSDALKALMIPVEYVGSLQLSDFPVIQDALAYMKLLADPFNNGVSFAKVLFREGVTEHNLQKINIQALQVKKTDPTQGDGIYSVLLNDLDYIDITQAELVKSILSRIEEVISYKKNHLPSDTVKYLLTQKTDLYRSQLARNDEHSRRNIKLLNSLVQMVADLELVDGGSEFEAVMEHLALVFNMDIDEGEASEDNTVKVMTIHQSKGKETKVVFVCDLAARHLPLQHRRKPFTVPSDMAKGVQRNADEKELHLEEERRLAYVAMTRAKEKLYLVFPEKYAANVKPSKPSQFLDEIDYENNPLIEFIEAAKTEVHHGTVSVSILQRKKEEYENLVSMYARQGQLDQALESIVVLAQLKELEMNGNLSAFDLGSFLKVSPLEPAELDDLVDGTVPPLVDQNMRFSASKIKEYMDCPLRFKYNSVLRIPTPQKGYFNVGTSVHAVYEEMIRQKMQGKSPSVADAKTMLNDTWNGSAFTSTTREQQEKNKMENMLDIWFDYENTNPNETIDVEQWFDLELEGNHFVGSIDRIDKTPDDEYIIIDYKTGKTTLSKKKMKEDVQLALYCLAVKEKYGKLPMQAGHFYVHPDKAKMVLVDVAVKEVDAVVARVKEVVKGILREDFEVLEDPECRYCDFGAVCEWVNGK